MYSSELSSKASSSAPWKWCESSYSGPQSTGTDIQDHAQLLKNVTLIWNSIIKLKKTSTLLEWLTSKLHVGHDDLLTSCVTHKGDQQCRNNIYERITWEKLLEASPGHTWLPGRWTPEGSRWRWQSAAGMAGTPHRISERTERRCRRSEISTSPGDPLLPRPVWSSG